MLYLHHPKKQWHEKSACARDAVAQNPGFPQMRLRERDFTREMGDLHAPNFIDNQTVFMLNYIGAPVGKTDVVCHPAEFVIGCP
jgi:hypothetical protein